jgi:hypothetical protein
VTPAAVKEDLDVVEDLAAEFGLGRPGAPVDEFLLERGEEALGDGVVPAIAAAAPSIARCRRCGPAGRTRARRTGCPGLSARSARAPAGAARAPCRARRGRARCACDRRSPSRRSGASRCLGRRPGTASPPRSGDTGCRQPRADPAPRRETGGRRGPRRPGRRQRGSWSGPSCARPDRPAWRISRSTRLRATRSPSAMTSSAWILGDP